VKKIVKFLPLLVLLITIIFFAFLLNYRSNQDINKEDLIAKSIPEISLKFLDDKNSSFNLQYLKESQDKYFLIHFFASWCSPCIADHEKLLFLSKKNVVDIYAILWQDLEDNGKKFIENNGNPYKKIAIDSNGIFGKKIGVKGVPETFLIDKNGKIIKHYQGSIKYDDIIDLIKFINNG